MRRSTWGMVLATVCVALWAVPVLAQPGQGGRGQGGGFGRGGFGGGRGGFDMTFPLLNAEQIQTELNISDEQKEQLTALQEESQANAPDFRQAFQDLGEDATEEERNAVFTEMREAMEAQQAENKAKLAEILAADQVDRLRELRWQWSGVDALRDAEVAEALALTDEQKEQLEEVLDERGEARREQLGRDASDEDRAAFNEEWDAKVKEVLTAEQGENWTVLLGDTFEFDRQQIFAGFGGGGGRGGFGGPGGGGFGPGGPGGGRPGGRPEAEDDDADDDEGTDDDEV